MKKYVFTLMLMVVTFTLTLPLAAQESENLPLAERGSYHVGAQTLTFVDETRDGRQVLVSLWYPGVVPESDKQRLAALEQEHLPVGSLLPDMSGAPYPVVLYSHGYNGSPFEFDMILEPLVSQGFVVAHLRHLNSTSALTFVDRPLDVLFAIDQLAALNEDPNSTFAGLMNVEQTGVIGFNNGAYTALAVSGARVDPEYMSGVWNQWGDFIDDAWPDWDWAAMTAYHDRFVPPTPDDPLWTAASDRRIRAVVPYMPCDVYQFGERGLAAETVPTLLIGGTEMGACSYETAAVPAYAGVGSAERYLLTLMGAGLRVPSPYDNTEPVVQQFVTAFFGYYLQGKAEYAAYLTEDYAETLDNVVWGIDETAVTDPQYITEMKFSDGGTAAIGETIAGEIVEAGSRVGYTLTLDADMSLNFYACAAGLRTRLPGAGKFDPVVYIYDAEGDALFWNDELTHDDDAVGNYDAGLEEIALPAGSYTVIVGGWSHITGPYELEVENAE